MKIGELLSNHENRLESCGQSSEPQWTPRTSMWMWWQNLRRKNWRLQWMSQQFDVTSFLLSASSTWDRCPSARETPSSRQMKRLPYPLTFWQHQRAYAEFVCHSLHRGPSYAAMATLSWPSLFSDHVWRQPLLFLKSTTQQRHKDKPAAMIQNEAAYVISTNSRRHLGESSIAAAVRMGIYWRKP